MSRAAYVLAVDGGGSKTAAALLDPAGTVLAATRAGPANLYREPAAGLAEIAGAWTRLCAMAGLVPAQAAAATIVSAGLAGIGGPAQRAAFASAFADFGGRCLSSDGYTAFLGVFGAGMGALLSVGTGIVAYRRGADGPLRQRSGWGFPAADRGSGAWLGARLVADYLDQLDGAASLPGSSLWPQVAERIGTDREPILAWLRTARAADFATLAPAIVAAAGQDELAAALLAEAQGHVRRLALALAPSPAAPLALAGGLAGIFRADLGRLLGAALLPAERPCDPLHGAWLIATGAVPPEYPMPGNGGQP